MTNNSQQSSPLPERLRERLGRDFKPVTPLAPAWKRILTILPIWVILAACVVLFIGIRNDYEILTPEITWLFAIGQATLASLGILFTLNLTIPGSISARSNAFSAAIVLLVVYLGLVHFTFHLSPIEATENFWYLIAVCLFCVIIFSLPPLVLAGYLASQGLPGYPILTGFLSGICCGLLGESVWRLHCHYTAWDHILGSHTSGILLAALLGAGIGYLYKKRRFA